MSPQKRLDQKRKQREGHGVAVALVQKTLPEGAGKMLRPRRARLFLFLWRLYYIT